MNNITAINVWKGNNRVSRLWEDLIADRVSPDPPDKANTSPGTVLGNPLLMQTYENESPTQSLLEKAGFESLRLIKNALDILSAPYDEDAAVESGLHRDPGTLSAGQMDWTEAVFHDPVQSGSAVGLTYVKVSMEPEPQPGSAIDTRRIAYGLKIPHRPLHKRPIYQRLFFCLRHMMTRRTDADSPG